MTAVRRLMKEYQELTVNAPEGITAGPITEDDFFKYITHIRCLDYPTDNHRWEALISGPDGSPFEGGLFPATLTFPKDYPLSPPVMRFECDLYHPNVYKNGEVCISILHAPGDDPNHYEQVRHAHS